MIVVADIEAPTLD